MPTIPTKLQCAPARDQPPMPQAAFYAWPGPGDTAWALFFNLPATTLVRFPGLADFEISDLGAVTCHPAHDVPERTIEHLYLNQVLPLALSRIGKLVFHASAVSVGTRCIAFMGPSGRGKSTLAAAFSTTGYRFLTDDGLQVEHASTGCQVIPSHPTLRLWPDSRQAVTQDASDPAPENSAGRSKARFLAGDQFAFCDQPLPLQSVFLLGDGSSSAITIQPVKPQDSLIALLRNSFLLNLHREESLASHFDELARLSRLPIFFRLDYPRQFALLPDLMEQLVRHVNERDVRSD